MEKWVYCKVSINEPTDLALAEIRYNMEEKRKNLAVVEPRAVHSSKKVSFPSTNIQWPQLVAVTSNSMFSSILSEWDWDDFSCFAFFRSSFFRFSSILYRISANARSVGSLMLTLQ